MPGWSLRALSAAIAAAIAVLPCGSFGARAARAEEPPWSVVLDDRTQAASYRWSPSGTAGAGLYRGDDLFFAPFTTAAVDRDQGETKWGLAASLFWLDGEPYIESENRDGALRTFLSGYVSAPLAELADTSTSWGRLRIGTRYGARLDVEHVFPELSAGAALGVLLSPSDHLDLFLHLSPTARFPDANYSLATSHVDLLLVPEPWIAADAGLRLLPSHGPERVEVSLRGALGSTTSEVGARIEAELGAGVVTATDLTLTRAYGGTVDRRIAEPHVDWLGAPSFELMGETVNAVPGLGARVGSDRFGTVEEQVLEIHAAVTLTWGPTVRAVTGYRADAGRIHDRSARYDFGPEEQRFLDTAVRVRDSAGALVKRLDRAIAELGSESPEAVARAIQLVDQSSHVLGALARVLDQARQALGAKDPDVARLLHDASSSLRGAASGLQQLATDPAHAAQAVLGALKPVRRAIDEAFNDPILGGASLDDMITGLDTVPHAFTEELGAEEINGLIHNLAHDKHFGFLLSEIDVLLLADWKDRSARGLEPVTANDVFRFFSNQLADQTLGLLKDGLGALADEYKDHPEAVLRRVPGPSQASARRFFDALATLKAKDLIDENALRQLLPDNTLTQDTAITVANLINGKVLRARQALTDFRTRLTVRGGSSIDQILDQDLDSDWERLPAR